MIETWFKDAALSHSLQVLLWLCEHADSGRIVVESKVITIPPATMGLFLAMRTVLTSDISHDKKVEKVVDMFANFNVRNGGSA